ncbi:MAG: helix-turn-helix domain-containing protein [Eubacteriaceae bacterium]|nr:helix-turn-helix domain-containing protein [Eubacteriaceae bacterium]
MIRKKNSRLTHKERIQIETLLNENKSKAYIAKTLHRSRSTITREVNKWVQSDKDKYDGDLAYWWAKENYLSKRNFDKIST